MNFRLCDTVEMMFSDDYKNALWLNMCKRKSDIKSFIE